MQILEKKEREQSEEHAHKVVVRKERRLLSKFGETAKRLTNGKREHKSLQSGTMVIKREGLCQEPNLKPHYHLDALHAIFPNASSNDLMHILFPNRVRNTSSPSKSVSNPHGDLQFFRA